MTRTAVALAFVVLLQLAAGAATATTDAEPAEPAPTVSAPPASAAPDVQPTDRAEGRDATPDGPLPGTGGRTSVLVGGALLVAAVVHWRLTAPPPPRD